MNAGSQKEENQSGQDLSASPASRERVAAMQKNIDTAMFAFSHLSNNSQVHEIRDRGIQVPELVASRSGNPALQARQNRTRAYRTWLVGKAMHALSRSAEDTTEVAEELARTESRRNKGTGLAVLTSMLSMMAATN